MSDEEIIKGCLQGNLFAQKCLFEKYSRKMLGVCFRYSTDKQEAQDILQEAFIKVFKKLDTYKGTGSLEGWIRRIAVHTAIENFRSKKTKHEVDIEDAEDEANTNPEVEAQMNADDIMKFINLLPDGYKMVFNLFSIEGYSHKEIADRLNISENTSYSQYSRAKAQLRKWLQSDKESFMKRVI
ncbi:MAG: RNA polymerase sigma factor [Flavobacteriales bacterium]|nr:RNA polymerase sigma factor [Flavobacteriales bacterium]